MAIPARLAAWPRRSSVNGLAKPTTPDCSLDVTALESPPTDAAPHVTTEPSALSAAKAPLVAKRSTTPEAVWPATPPMSPPNWPPEMSPPASREPSLRSAAKAYWLAMSFTTPPAERLQGERTTTEPSTLSAAKS